MLHSMILSLVPHFYRMHRGTNIMATAMGTGRRRLPRPASASAASCTPAAGPSTLRGFLDSAVLQCIMIC